VGVQDDALRGVVPAIMRNDMPSRRFLTNGNSKKPPFLNQILSVETTLIVSGRTRTADITCEPPKCGRSEGTPMCYAKPGPRCSNHATKALTKARAAYKSDPTEENRANLDTAVSDYEITPAGIKEIRDEAMEKLTHGDIEGGVALTKTADANQEKRELLKDLAKRQTPFSSFVNKVLDGIRQKIAKSGLKAKLDRYVATGGTKAEKLSQLASSDDQQTRCFVASNPNTPADALRALAQDKDRDIRVFTATNSNTPHDVLIALAHDEHDFVISAAAGNANTPRPTLVELSNHESDYVQQGLASNASTPKEILEGYAHSGDAQTRACLAANPSVSFKTKEQLTQDKDAGVRIVLATSKNTPTDVLRALTFDKDNEVRAFMAAQSHTPPEILDLLKRDKDRHVRQLAAMDR
jgi:hypothetical protein